MKFNRSKIVFGTITLMLTLATISCDIDDSPVETEVYGNNGNQNEKIIPDVSGRLCGHDYVDLGLESGTLWATCNIGAKNPEEYGDFFAWGETEKKDYFGDNSMMMGISYTELKKNGVIDSNGEITEKYDAATVNWGVRWKIPTCFEFEELCKLRFGEIEINGKSYSIFYGKNGNKLILPDAGYQYKDST